MNNPPKCKDCNQFMFEVGEVGKETQLTDLGGDLTQIVQPKLYQCPEDKTVAIQ